MKVPCNREQLVEMLKDHVEDGVDLDACNMEQLLDLWNTTMPQKGFKPVIAGETYLSNLRTIGRTLDSMMATLDIDGVHTCAECGYVVKTNFQHVQLHTKLSRMAESVDKCRAYIGQNKNRFLWLGD